MKGEKIKCSAEIVYTAANAPVHSSDKNNIVFFPGTTPCSGLGDTFFSKGAPEFFVNRRIPIPGELIRDLRSKLVFVYFSSELVHLVILYLMHRFCPALNWTIVHGS